MGQIFSHSEVDELTCGLRGPLPWLLSLLLTACWHSQVPSNSWTRGSMKRNKNLLFSLAAWPRLVWKEKPTWWWVRTWDSWFLSLPSFCPSPVSYFHVGSVIVLLGCWAATEGKSAVSSDKGEVGVLSVDWIWMESHLKVLNNELNEVGSHLAQTYLLHKPLGIMCIEYYVDSSPDVIFQRSSIFYIIHYKQV